MKRDPNLKAKGPKGDIARLRQTCRDAADILQTMAEQLDAGPLTEVQRAAFAGRLRRASDYMRSLVFLTQEPRKP
jgi:hypothetical protein